MNAKYDNTIIYDKVEVLNDYVVAGIFKNGKAYFFKN